MNWAARERRSADWFGERGSDIEQDGFAGIGTAGANTCRVRVLRILVLLALLGTFVGVPARASTRGQLVLRGTGNVGIDLVLVRGATLDLRRFVPDSSATFSGIVVRDGRGRQLGIAIQVHRWTTTKIAPAPLVTRDVPLVLAPGRYRLELLASGPATVRVGATGELMRSFAPRLVTSSQVALTDLRGIGVPVVDQRYPGVSIAPGRAALLVFFERSTAHQASVPQLCFAAQHAPSCAQAYGFTTALESVGSVGDGWVQSFTALYGGQGLDGQYDALVQDVTVDLPAGLDALLVQV